MQGRQQQDAGDYEAALAAFQRAADMKFQPAGAMMRMAQIYGIQGNTDTALSLLKNAFELNPTTVALLPQLGGVPALEEN
ncbi:MAG: hypothetical protein WBS20_04410, partial [Lysobacterales bacterium]